MVPCEDNTAPNVLPLWSSFFDTRRLSDVDRKVAFLLRMINIARRSVSHGEGGKWGEQLAEATKGK